MQRLAASDLEAALRFVAEAAAETGPDPFPEPIVERLRELLGCEWASYCELDRPQRRGLVLVECPVPDIGDEDDELFWRIVEQHPLCEAQRRRRFDALKVSDFYTRRQLHRLELYADWYRPTGVEDELEVGIPSPLSHTKTFLFDSPGPEFTERDRALLNLLQPHLIALYRAAEVRRLAADACAVIEASNDAEGRGVVIIDARGNIELATPRARSLLAAYVPHEHVLADWLAAQPLDRPPSPLSIDGESGTLVVDLERRSGIRVLLLEEQAPGPEVLSAREREVLTLVADGLRNAEIAEALWLSPATVRKHLENIYAKLDVHTRTAAVARMSELA